MARKTVKVEDLVDRTNLFLSAPNSSNTPDVDSHSMRVGMIALLESVLHETGNYAGFNYQPSEFSEPGVLRDDYDNSRRIYFRKV